MNERIRCKYRSPHRRSVELANGLWGTRQWLPGERQQYEERVLTRRDPADLCKSACVELLKERR